MSVGQEQALEKSGRWRGIVARMVEGWQGVSACRGPAGKRSRLAWEFTSGGASLDQKKEPFVQFQLPLLVWMLVIFISSAIPGYDFPHVQFWGWAKLVHLIYYGVLCFLAQRALRHQGLFPFLSRYSSLFAVVIAVLYGCTDEFHQRFTPGRHAMAMDVFIDGLGACLFIAGVEIHREFKRRTKSITTADAAHAEEATEERGGGASPRPDR
jgi:hypothetical protein